MTQAWWEKKLEDFARFHNVLIKSKKEPVPIDVLKMVVKQLLDQQTKRDWEEFKELLDSCTDFTDGGTYVSYLRLSEAIDSKIKEL